MDNDRKSSKEEGSNTHREDREAKRKAHRSIGGAEAPVPGARASKGEHKSRTKSTKRPNDDSERSRKSHEKSDYHKSPRSSASVPGGAQAELSSPRSRSKRDGKGTASRASRATKPGERNKNKSSGIIKSNKNSNTEDRVNEEGAPVIVEEKKEDEDAKKEREQALINEKEKERQQMRSELRRMQKKEQEMERKEAERKEKNRKQKKKQRNITVCVVLVGLLIGGGVAAFFVIQGGEELQVSSSEPSTPLALDPTDDPSADPSSVPTNVPPLKYEQPGPIECERIASGLPIDGEEEMVAQSFDILMEVVLVDGNDIDPLRVQQLATQIEKLLVPDLIGCPREFFDERRLIRHNPTSGHSISGSIMLPHANHRQLESTSIRYAIAKAMVTVTVPTDDACEKSSSANCTVVSLNLDLTIRGKEEIIFLAELILDIFPKDRDIRPDLELIAPFDTIVIGILRSLDPAPAQPTVAPTGTASENPSTAPSTVRFSTSPTSSPLAGPSDPTPVIDPITPAPTKSPTKSPTVPPTIAPTANSPTFAPQPGPSPAPTPPPTASPTKAPTKSPTKGPTRKPSGAPSPSPSIKPSAAPSTGPTSPPSFNPTATPTSAPRLGFTPLLRQGMIFEQSSTYTDYGISKSAAMAFDGDYETFFSTDEASNQWWRANLHDFYRQLVTVNKVTVWNRMNCCPDFCDRTSHCTDRLIGATVKLYGAGTDNLIAQSAPLTSALIQTIDFGEVTGVQYVQVHLALYEFLHFAEIEVWGSIPNDSNNQGYAGLINEGMSVDQSSTYSFDGISHTADNAVDGNYDTFSCVVRARTNQWWRANLQDYYGQLVTVNKITVWNRADCCQERLEGATVRLYGSGTDNLIAQSAPLTSALIQTVDFGEATGVLYFQIHQVRRMEYLHFAEIEVWGKVPY